MDRKKQKTYKRSLFFLGALAMLLLGSTVYYAKAAEKGRMTLHYGSQRAMSELISELSQMDSALNKLRYANSDKAFEIISAKLWQSAETAKTAMASLSLEPGLLDSTEKFVAQTGDFAYFLLFENAGGQEIDFDHLDAIDSLYTASEEITREISAVKGQLDQGQLALDDFDHNTGTAALSLSDGLSGVEQEFPEYATLIYDGPFSEHMADREPKLVKNLKEVTLEQALKNAAAFSGRPLSSLSLLYEEGGAIPAWCIAGEAGVTLEVARQGGIVFAYRDPRDVGSRLLSPEQAIEAAEDFLEERGFDNMEESYYTTFDGAMTINFAYEENDITVYSDLIKVTVALDDGAVIGMEARGYVMSHHSRTLPRPVISADTAKNSLSPRLILEEQKLALTPTEGQNEVLCWEHLCHDGEGQRLLVYINAETGQEENLFILVEDGSGTLTM